MAFPDNQPCNHRNSKMIGHGKEGCKRVQENQIDMSRNRDPSEAISRVCVARLYIF